MAAVTSAAVSIPSFTGLKATAGSTTASKAATVSAGGRISAAPKLTVKSSLKDIGVAAVAAAAAASIVIPGHAMAYEVLLGTTNGELIFVPKEFTVAKGEKIVFKNNGGFPHNVVFDDDGVPSGVDAGKISMDLSEYLNGPDESYSVTLTEPGTYTFYCAPHESAGMRGSVTVN